MKITINNGSDDPIYEQIFKQIKGIILSGELNEGEGLPSMRLLAKELRISVITTKRAYEELEKAGFIYSITGKGSFVKASNKEIVKEEYLKKVEEGFRESCMNGKLIKLSLSELKEILEIIYEED